MDVHFNSGYDDIGVMGAFIYHIRVSNTKTT